MTNCLRDELALAITRSMLANFDNYGFETIQEFAEVVWAITDIVLEQRNKPYELTAIQKLKFH
jgi:hypothetical protein